MSDDGPLDHVNRNRDLWDGWAAEWFERGERAWAMDEACWGIHQIAESELGLLNSFSGGKIIELGCGTGYVSAWLARLGGDPVGVDNSLMQLSSAHQLQKRFDLYFPLIHADAENLPFVDESFDFAISEYGAAIWCDPYRWIPEVARVLRSGGRLVFLGNSTQIMLSVPDDDGPATTALQRPQFGMHRMEWDDDPGVEFHLSHGDRIKLLRANGFEIEDLIELYPSSGALESSYTFVTLDWARQWPAEEAWIARKV
ncbi:MAG: class I SAM-dependent methyltransferase [Actinomycetota bacterium]|nr:class I SAM-dependent methyltransferase [Actinomycetota bacterium]MED5361714.1 class I SAM-dependent methyltransferase [Actinomycetota bacterium]MEE3256256.1 class I SAM-dependent methyltransferase [Actinomycetota bacterium]